MKINGFHRGAHDWVASFELDGRQRVAFFDRDGQWKFAGMEKIDAKERVKLNAKLTEKLREILKTSGQIAE